MRKMQQTMRWFGPHDSVKLTDIKQAGATGIVTALHHIPVGEVWTIDDIKERQSIIQHAGLEWTVIESLPVHEDIKRRAGNYKTYIEHYKTSLKNIATCGIKVVIYNFMPILDWVRTEHAFTNPDGTKALRYNKMAFMYFDLYLLKRPGAESDYTETEKQDALWYGNALSEEERQTLFKNVLLGLPGSTTDFTPNDILTLLDNYKKINDKKLREHLIAFLAEIVPVAEQNGLKLAIHPDDPPFSVMGLPRIVSNQKDLKLIFDDIPHLANGLCYCTGSLGASPENNLLDIIDAFEERIHFLHIRNVVREDKNIFRESDHLNGSNPINEIMEKLILLMQKRDISLPMRPDHGFLHDMEASKNHYPGYSLIGRLKGLAELRGLEQGIMYKMLD